MVRPEPTNPATPTISPALIWKRPLDLVADTQPVDIQQHFGVGEQRWI
jgi:hypothetical protein